MTIMHVFIKTKYTLNTFKKSKPRTLTGAINKKKAITVIVLLSFWGMIKNTNTNITTYMFYRLLYKLILCQNVNNVPLAHWKSYCISRNVNTYSFESGSWWNAGNDNANNLEGHL